MSLLIQILLSPHQWAMKTFGRTQLGDKRRTPRAVQMADKMIRKPSASLPNQLQSPSFLKAAYRLVAEDDVTMEAILEPSWQASREVARSQDVVLIVQDTTHVDYTRRRKMKNVGPIGDGKGQGFLLHTALGIVPSQRAVIGLMYQKAFLRQVTQANRETHAQRRSRPRESQVWEHTVEAIGDGPAPKRWVHVGDRGSDVFEFLDACRQRRTAFLIRAAHNRRLMEPQGELDTVFDLARAVEEIGRKQVNIPPRHGKPGRIATVAYGVVQTQIKPPEYLRDRQPITVWLIRAWEVDAPADVPEPLEWVLLTSVETTTQQEVEERLDWYTCRWLVEDYHQCLKTGAALEDRQFQDGEHLIRFVGFLSPIATRLLQLREIARLNPSVLASDVLPPDLVALVAHLTGFQSDRVTMHRFWRLVARLGGYQDRLRDGPPGWKTLWRGWLHVQTLLEGAKLVSQLAAQKSG